MGKKKEKEKIIHYCSSSLLIPALETTKKETHFHSDSSNENMIPKAWKIIWNLNK